MSALTGPCGLLLPQAYHIDQGRTTADANFECIEVLECALHGYGRLYYGNHPARQLQAVNNFLQKSVSELGSTWALEGIYTYLEQPRADSTDFEVSMEVFLAMLNSDEVLPLLEVKRLMGPGPRSAAAQTVANLLTALCVAAAAIGAVPSATARAGRLPCW